jgi:trigger factor
MVQSGFTAKQYLEASGQSEEDIRNMMKPEAEKSVKTSLVLEAIVKAEAIEASDEEVEAEYKKLAENYGMEIDRIKQLISVDNIKYDLAQQKAIELLKNSVK